VDKEYPIYHDQPEALARHMALVRKSLDMALEILKRESRPNTFLGRQHYRVIPLPYEQEERRQ
jgi:hypothetical protein